ncbi:hypothetical protein J7E49_00705 [Variovorax paradoxus]|nr:hypothetical protein [Variovorax paradoxus]
MTKLTDKLVSALTPTRVVILIGLALLAWSVYQAPDNFDRADPSERAILIGSLLASYVLDGNAEALKEYVLKHDPADEKLAKPLPNFSDIIVWQEIEKTKALPPNHYLWEPVKSAIYADSRDDARIPVRLRTFEYVPGVYVMTFVGLSGHVPQNLVKRGGEPMMASIFVRHVLDREDFAAFRVVGRKIANAFWMNERGTAGRWLLIDFKYNFNRRGYFDWVRSNGEQLYEESKARNEAFTSDAHNQINAILEKSQLELVQRYDWASARMREQQAFVAATER